MKKPVRIPQALSKGEEAFALCLRLHPEIPEPVRQFRFHPERRWTWDFCWPPQMLALEIEGKTWRAGRHTRGKGFAEDLTKHNSGQMLGWRILRFTTAQATSCEAVSWVAEFFDSWVPVLSEIPARIVEMSDTEVLEVQLIENLQRDDLDALAEAEGYQRLMKLGKYDVATIAGKIGKSTKYVWDRVKLLELTPEGKKLLADGEITAGHAILLARLKPEIQKKAIESKGYDQVPGLFMEEDTPYLPGVKSERAKKAVSIRELQTWIDDNVRLVPGAPEAHETFPDMAAAIAEEPPEKVVSIRLDSTYGPEREQDKKDGIEEEQKPKRIAAPAAGGAKR